MKRNQSYVLAFTLSLAVGGILNAMSTPNNTSNASTATPKGKENMPTAQARGAITTPKVPSAEELEAKKKQDAEEAAAALAENIGKRNEAFYAAVKGSSLPVWEKLVLHHQNNIETVLEEAQNYASKVKKDIDATNTFIDLRQLRRDNTASQLSSSYTLEMSDEIRLAMAIRIGDTEIATQLVNKYDQSANQIALYQCSANYAAQKLNNLALTNKILQQKEGNETILSKRAEQEKQKEAEDAAKFENHRRDIEAKFIAKMEKKLAKKDKKFAEKEAAIRQESTYKEAALLKEIENKSHWTDNSTFKTIKTVVEVAVVASIGFIAYSVKK